MKKIQLLCILMLLSFAALAQSPTLFFRFNNMQTVTEGETDYFLFDVEVKADIAGTYQRDMQIYFDYNPAVFGESIKLNNKVTIEKIGVMAGEIAPGTPKYKWVGEGTADGFGTDNTPTRYYITSEPSLISAPLASFHNLMPIDWVGYMRVKIIIANPGPAGIQYLGPGFIDGGCYYFDPATGEPVVYTFPYTYENNLLDYMVGAQPEYTLTLDVFPVGAGNVTQSGTGSYMEGTSVALTATPNTCYSFVNWTNGSTVVSTDASFNYLMPAENVTLTANFQQLTYNITASAGTGGTITPNGTIAVVCGGSQYFDIMPATGYLIEDVLVDGSSVGAVSSHIFDNVTANHTISTSFVQIPTYTLTLAVDPAGAGVVGGGGTFEAGTLVAITATPNTCYSFLNWTDGSTVVSTAPNFNYSMPAENVTLTANFELLTYTITASAGTGGSITPSGVETVNCDADQTFVIAPAEGYTIGDVLVDGSSVGAVPSYTFYNVMANHTISTSFNEIPPMEYALSLDIDPMGAGTVTGAGTYEEGEVVPLTATANTCYTFVNWTDGSTVVSTAPNFNYTMPAQNVTLTANFQLETYTITASASIGGTIIPDGTVTVNCGSNQTFIISASGGYEIYDVMVDSESQGPVSTYTFENVMSNHTILAIFSEIPPTMYTLTVNITGMGDVLVNSVAYTVPVQAEEGASLNLQAVADMGWMFEGWTGDLVSTDATETILMNEDKTITATFTEIPPTMYTLTVNIVGMGDVLVNSVSYTIPVVVEEGTSLNLQAVANMGWMFEGWTGDLVSTDATETILMNEDKTITATFTEIPPTMYTLTVNIAGMGDVLVNSVAYTVPVQAEEGASLNLQAVADMGWMFEGWTGDLVSTDATETIQMNENKTITATFIEIPPNMYTLMVNIVGMGDVLVNSVSYTIPVVVEEGTSLNLQAVADMGWMFEGWTGDLVSTDATETILMNEDKTITATFTEIPPTMYTLTVNIVGMGDVLVNSVSYTIPVVVEEDTSLNLQAVADMGWMFEGWTGDLVSTDATETILMDEDKTITATFIEIPPTMYTLTVNIVGMGDVLVNSVSYTIPVVVEEGTSLNLQAVPDMGWIFEGWTGDLVSTNATETILMNEDKTITATFTEIPPTMYILTVNIVGMGDVLVNSVAYTVPVQAEEGTSLNLQAVADMGWMFEGWTGDLVSANAMETILMDADKTITATFTEEAMMYTLTLVADPMDGGILDGAGNYAAGTPVMVYAYPNANYLFVNWTWGETIVSYDSSFEFTMPEENVTLVAHFELMEYVYCAYSQGYWFAKPQTVWPYDVIVGGMSFNQEEGMAFWQSNTPTKRAFTQYAAIFLSGVTLSEFPELEAAMMLIDDYFANVYPEPAGKEINRAAGFIGEWIEMNECYDNYQGLADLDLISNHSEDLSWYAKAYPNPFRTETNIEFMVEENLDVTLEVFNMVGERITVLFDGPVEAYEKYSVTLRMKDRYTGFYFYRLMAGEKIHTGRLIMVK